MTGDGWRLARERKGLTLRALARTVGISAPHMSDVEHGRRRYSPEMEARVRAALDLDPTPAPAPKCVVCEGPLTERTWSEYRGDPMHMILGPGSANQMTTVHGIWCDRCGLSYRHVPRPSPRGTGTEGGK